MSIPRQTCAVCRDQKPLTPEFWHRNKTRRSGFSGQCKFCTNQRQREQRKSWEEKYPVRERPVWVSLPSQDSTRIRTYRLFPNQFEALREAQSDNCAICAGELIFDGNQGADSSVIDHCHETLEVRGLVHNRCNTYIHLVETGRGEGDPRHESTIRYITAPPAREVLAKHPAPRSVWGGFPEHVNNPGSPNS